MSVGDVFCRMATPPVILRRIVRCSAIASPEHYPCGYPLWLIDRHRKEGSFYVWTMPDNFHNLYEIAPAVMSAIKDVLMKGFLVRLDGSSQVALFAYDNHRVIVQSFLSAETTVRLGALGSDIHLRDLTTGEIVTGELPQRAHEPHAPEQRVSFYTSIAPHSFRAFALQQ